MAPDAAAKVAAWRQQSAALGAPAYRITLKPRREADDAGKKLAPRNFGNEGHKEKGTPERFWTAAEVEAAIPKLRRENARGYDIYITPIDNLHHYLVVDDMTPASAQALKAAGYRPVLIQQSSANNQQAIIKIERDKSRHDEQSLANNLVQTLNQLYGDPKFSGVIHPFRMAGFANKKPGKENAFTKIVEAGKELCRKAGEALAAIRQKVDDLLLQQSEQRRQAERTTRAEAVDRDLDGQQAGDAVTAYRRAARYVQSWVKNMGLTEDWSRIDFQAAKSMLKGGWTGDEVQQGILAGSPGVIDRHNDPVDYAVRTVRNAAAEPDVVKHLAEQARQQHGSGFSR